MHRVIIAICFSLFIALLVLVMLDVYAGPGLVADAAPPNLAEMEQRLIFQQGSPTTTPTSMITATVTISPTLTNTSMPGQTLTPEITSTGLDLSQTTTTPITWTATVENTLLPGNQLTGTISPTATLIPFPTVSMVFPTSQAIATATPAIAVEDSGRVDILRLLVIFGLLVFWAALIYWFWYVQRRAH